jgi:hypothetical protein
MGSAAAAAAFDISEFLSQRAEFEECDGDGSGGLSLLEFKCVQAAAALLFVPALLMLFLVPALVAEGAPPPDLEALPDEIPEEALALPEDLPDDEAEQVGRVPRFRGHGGASPRADSDRRARLHVGLTAPYTARSRASRTRRQRAARSSRPYSR